MTTSRFAFACVAGLLGSGACFVAGSGPPSPDASTPVDSSVPVEASADSPAGSADATVSDAEAGTSAPPDAGDAADAPADVPAESAPTTNCGAWDAQVELEASDPDAGVSTNSEGGATLPGPRPSVCSLLGDMPAPIEVTNNAPCPVDVWWVDYGCNEQFFGTVDPDGGTFNNDTWETHPWRIRQTGSEALLVEIPPLPEGADASLRMINYP